MRIIAGSARSRIIDAPKGQDTRPTLDRVRETVFDILQSLVPGSRVLDLYAGSDMLSSFLIALLRKRYATLAICWMSSMSETVLKSRNRARP